MSDRSVARLHPAIITIASFVTAGFLATFTVTVEDPASYRAAVAIFAFIAFIALGVWLRALYRVALARLGRGEKATGWFLFIPAFGLAISKLIPPGAASAPEQLVASISLFVGGFGYIFATWRVAQELALADAVGVRVSTGRIFGTFVALFYIFIGAWVLRPKILRLTEA